MRETRVSKLVPSLWYTDKAEEAAAFYASILPNSKVDSALAAPDPRVAVAPLGGATPPEMVKLNIAEQKRAYDGR
jgi:hypothetical protein